MHRDNGPISSSFKTAFDFLIEGLLLLLLLFLPLALGARAAWSEEVFILLSGVIVSIFTLRNLFCPRESILGGGSFIPVALFLAFVTFQLIPLPGSCVKMLSPNTYGMKMHLLSDLFTDQRAPDRMTLSFYPWATRHDLRVLFALAGLFWVVSRMYSDPGRIKRILRWIALTGGVIALIAILQKVFGNGKIYGFIPTDRQGFFGPFVNHSHYAQYMNLTLGAVIGLVGINLYEKFSGAPRTPNEIFKYLFSPSSGKLWFLLVLLAVGTATVYISLSRGGMISTLSAFAVIAVLMLRRGQRNMDSFSVALTGLIAFTIVLFLGFEAVYDRFGSIFDVSQYHWRAQILKDMTDSFKLFTLWGTGQGTYSVVYPIFQRINTSLLFTHAENEYAQVLGETGLIGLGLLAFFMVILLVNLFGLFRAKNDSVYVVSYGLAFGLIAILIHSLSDFGQHVPCNAVLSIIFAGIITALARKVKKKELKPGTVGIGRVLPVRIALLIAIPGVCTLFLMDADKARISEKYWKKTLAIEDRLSKNQWRADDRTYADLIRFAAISKDHQKGNVRYRHWYNVYRWQELKNRYDLNENGSDVAVQKTILSLVEELNRARFDCPSYGPLYCFVGRIEKFVLGDDGGVEKIKKAYFLCKNDPVICFNRGLVDLIEGRPEESIDKFRRALKLNPGLIYNVSNELICDFSVPTLAVEAADHDAALLSVTVNQLEQMEYYDIADRAREKMRRLLEAQCSLPKVDPQKQVMLGDVYRKKQMITEAIACYERALNADYRQVEWRYRLAEMLSEQKRFVEAVAQARICLRIQPQFQPARQLVMDLSVKKETF